MKKKLYFLLLVLCFGIVFAQDDVPIGAAHSAPQEFTDIESVVSWARESLNIDVACNIIVGDEATFTIRGRDYLTRNEAFVIAARLIRSECLEPGRRVVEDVVVDGEGDITVIYTDSDTKDLGNLRGPQGPAGPGYIDAYISDEGILYLVPTDGEAQALDDVVGPAGPQGPQGEPGISVTDAYIDDGDLVIVYGGEPDNLGDVTGPQGDPGRGIEEVILEDDGDFFVVYTDSEEPEFLGNIEGPRGAQGVSGEDGTTTVVYRMPDRPATTYFSAAIGGISSLAGRLCIGNNGLLSDGQQGLGLRVCGSINRAGGADATLFGVGTALVFWPYVAGSFNPYVGGGVYYQLGADAGTFDEPKNGFAGVVFTGMEIEVTNTVRPYVELGISRQFATMTDSRKAYVEFAFGVNFHF